MERGCRIVVRGAPEHVVAHRGFAVASRGSFLSVLDMTGLAGEVQLISEGSTLTYETRWWRRPAEDAQARDQKAERLDA
jgi:hypothetical protein